jgi:hypothetical protein
MTKQTKFEKKLGDAYHAAGHAVANLIEMLRIDMWHGSFQDVEITSTDREESWGYCPTLSGKMTYYPEGRAETLKDLARGIDRRDWMEADAVWLLCGPMAQAKHYGRPVDRILAEQTHCNSDRKYVEEMAADFADTDAEHAEIIAGIWAGANELINRPDVWRAIEMVAVELLDGMMDVDRVATIVDEAMGGRLVEINPPGGAGASWREDWREDEVA